MSSKLQMIFIRDSTTDSIKAFMQNSCEEEKKLMHDLQIKALDMCKNNDISLHKMQLFFPLEMLRCEVKLEIEDVDGRQEVFKTVATTPGPNEILKSSCQIHVEKKTNTDEARMFKVLKSVAATTVPDGLVLKRSDLEEALAGIFSFKKVEKESIFGPYIGFSVRDRQDAYANGYCWDVYKNNKFHHCVDARNSSESNWMRYVNPADLVEVQNLEAFQRGYQVYFRAIKDIPAGTELLVWYSLQYNQDCHQTIPNLKARSGKSFERIIFKIKNNRLSKKKVSKSYKCDVCDKAFIQRSALTTHTRTHKRIQTLEKPFKCDICDMAFTQRQHLKRHERIHTGENPFKCDICDKAFTQINNLKRHERIHTGERPFKCDTCDKCFNQKHYLKIHERYHTGKKPFECVICDKAFTQINNLKKHKRTHTGEKPYKCDTCNKAFINSYDLTVHKRIHTGEKPFKCEVCNKAFNQISSLNSHKRTHTGEKPFKCNICDKAYTQLTHLNRHKPIHTGEKPFKCVICDESYADKSNLNKHKCIHTREKTFKCDTFDQSFSRKDNLNTHKH